MINKPNRDKPFLVVAVDGGAASGKSSTSRELARRFNFLHVDTGAHYRAVALACLQAGVSWKDTANLRPFLQSMRLSARIKGHESLVCFRNSEPPLQEDLRSEAVNRVVSGFAAEPLVREAVKAYQRGQVDLAREQGFAGIIMDGRDIGTVILPDADLKIFLKADPAMRQRRRELEGGADTVTDRDRKDSTRATAPLMAAEDAVVIDNSHLSLPQVVEQVVALLNNLPPSA
ncbi:MAG TPA: (d)CMP kinase [Oceanipulchritudo sp.]|nr:(d)CMP kinase [Oceanipulchritudo sp.]